MTCGLDEGYRGWGKNHRKATCRGIKDTCHLVHTLYGITLVSSTLQIINYI